MFKFQLIILCCLVFLAKKSFSDDSSEESGFWCSDGILESLIKCLLQTNIQPNAVSGVWSRVLCAQQADCHPKPWNFFDKNIKKVKDFVECMEAVPKAVDEWYNGTMVLIDYKCREQLAQNLPNKFMMYYTSLVPEHFL